MKRLAQNSFFQGGILFFGAGVVANFFNYFFNVLSAHLLGPSGYGEIVALFSYVTILSVPLSVITTELIKRLGTVSDDKLIRAASWESWIIYKLSRYKLLFVPYFLSIFILPRLTNLSFFASGTLLLLLLLSIVLSFYQGVLQATQLFFLFTLVAFVGVGLKLLGPILVLLNIGDISIIYLLLIAGPLVSILLSKYFLIKRTPGKKSPRSIKRLRDVLFSKSLIVTIGSLVGITLLSNLDIIYVRKFFPASVSGIYGAWSLLAKIVLYVIGPIQAISLIFFSAANEKKRHKHVLIMILSLLFFIAIMIHFLYIFFGRQIVLLIFNNSFLQVLPLIHTSALFGFLYSGITITNTYFLAKNSHFALISVLFSPVYGLCLYLFGHTLENIIWININIALIILTISIVGLFRVEKVTPAA